MADNLLERWILVFVVNPDLCKWKAELLIGLSELPVILLEQSMVGVASEVRCLQTSGLQ